MSSNQPTVTAPPARFRLRVRYAKRGRLRYLGHLELIHTIERCIRRAALPYAVSQGFSPHMRVGYTSALPVGTSSSCEWYDVFLTDLVPLDEAMERLRAASPDDLAPAQAAYIDLRTPALTAQITRVGYRLLLYAPDGSPLTGDRVHDALEAVRALGTIEYRRGKKLKKLDLDRSLVSYQVSACGDMAETAGALPPDGAVCVDLDTRCDNEGSLRPEILLAAVDQALCGIEPGSREIVSSGIQDLSAIGRYEVERSWQAIEDEDGTLRDPLGARVDVSRDAPLGNL